jgi:hypothetical protein
MLYILLRRKLVVKVANQVISTTLEDVMEGRTEELDCEP